jgi:hypothetical protein
MMSRPWKVAATVRRKSFVLVISQTPSSEWSRATTLRRPLSGATNHCSAAFTAMIRRPEPTPGSITPRWTVPGGKASTMLASTNAPSWMFCGAMAWLTSTSWVPGASPRITPLSEATYGPWVPKSVVSVRILGVMTAPCLPEGPRSRSKPEPALTPTLSRGGGRVRAPL